MLLKIDGEENIRSTTRDETVVVTRNYAAGWHDFEARFGQGDGHYGPNGVDASGQPWTVGFGIDVPGRNSQVQADYVAPSGPAWFPYLDVMGPATLADDFIVTADSSIDVPLAGAAISASRAVGGCRAVRARLP